MSGTMAVALLVLLSTCNVSAAASKRDAWADRVAMAVAEWARREAGIPYCLINFKRNTIFKNWIDLGPSEIRGPNRQLSGVSFHQSQNFDHLENMVDSWSPMDLVPLARSPGVLPG